MPDNFTVELLAPIHALLEFFHLEMQSIELAMNDFQFAHALLHHDFLRSGFHTVGSDDVATDVDIGSLDQFEEETLAVDGWRISIDDKLAFSVDIYAAPLLVDDDFWPPDDEEFPVGEFLDGLHCFGIRKIRGTLRVEEEWNFAVFINLFILSVISLLQVKAKKLLNIWNRFDGFEIFWHSFFVPADMLWFKRWFVRGKLHDVWEHCIGFPFDEFCLSF